MKAGVLGGSGYAGAELLRLLAGHPEIEVAVVTADSPRRRAGRRPLPALSSAYRDPRPLTLLASGELDGLDLVFCALPHGESQWLVPDLLDQVGTWSISAADFRLRTPALYPIWYGYEHQAPGAARRVRVRPPRALPGRARRRHACRRAGLLRDRGLARPRAARPRPGGRADGHRRRRGQRGLRRGAGARATDCISAR